VEREHVALPAKAMNRSATPSVRVDWVPPTAAFTEEWGALADRLGAPPWSHPQWFSLWGEAFGVEWQALTVRRDGRLVGVVPLVARGRALEAPTNWHTPAFSPVAEQADLPDVALAALGGRAAWLSLGFVEAGDPAIDVLRRAAAETGSRLLTRPLEHSPYLDVDGDWNVYEQSLDGKLLREIRRRRRGLEASGRLTFDVESGGERLADLLDEGFAVEAAGWKGERGSAIASRAETESFYRSLAAWAAERGWLRIALLRIDGRAIAFDFCIEQGGVHYLLKTGFEPAQRRFAPGIVLRYLMLERAFAAPLRRYEFLGANDAWKLRWTQSTRERLLVQAFHPSPIGLAAWTAFAFGRPLAKRLLRLAGR
jgi:CelD/BcsL family acetyltransferase involved in cellulose biosynthesis